MRQLRHLHRTSTRQRASSRGSPRTRRPTSDPAWTPDGDADRVRIRTAPATTTCGHERRRHRSEPQLTSGAATDFSPAGIARRHEGRLHEHAERSEPRLHLEVRHRHLRDGHRRLRRHAGADQTDTPGCWLRPQEARSRLVPGRRTPGLRMERPAPTASTSSTTFPSASRRSARTAPARPSSGSTPSCEQAYDPAWSPDGTRVVYSASCCDPDGLTTIDADDGGNFGSRHRRRGARTGSPSRSTRPPPTCAPAARRRCGSPSCPPPSRARPRTAPTARRSHSAPAHRPLPGSPNLTVGVGDGSPAFSRSVGHVRLRSTLGVPATVSMTPTSGSRVQPLERDERLRPVRVHGRAARQRPGCGSPTARAPLPPPRRTSRSSSTCPAWAPSPRSTSPLCELTTTLDTLRPGAAAEGKRAVWALDQLKVYDGGPDGDADTTADNSLFAVQGVFVPANPRRSAPHRTAPAPPPPGPSGAAARPAPPRPVRPS